jgi:hypothetical protein
MINRSSLALMTALCACSPTEVTPAPRAPPQHLQAALASYTHDSPEEATISGGGGQDGWTDRFPEYSSDTVVEVRGSGTLQVKYGCAISQQPSACTDNRDACHAGQSAGSLPPAGRTILGACTSEGYGSIYVNWPTSSGATFEGWNACTDGVSATVMVRGFPEGGRSADSGAPPGSCLNCCATPCQCALQYLPGSDTITLTRLDADIATRVEDPVAEIDRLVTITASPAPSALQGIRTPMTIMSHLFIPDPPEKGEELRPLDYEACELTDLDGFTCFHRMRRGGTLITKAVVNGQLKQKSDRLDLHCGGASQCVCRALAPDVVTVPLSTGDAPMEVDVPCPEKFGGGKLGLSAKIEGTLTHQLLSCNNDCESESSAMIEGSVTEEFCGERTETNAIHVKAFQKIKSCTTCDQACNQTCKPGGCKQTGAEGGGAFTFGKKVEPKFLRSVTQKAASYGIRLECAVDLEFTAGASVAYESQKNESLCPDDCENCSSTTTTVDLGFSGKAGCTVEVGHEDYDHAPGAACIGCFEVEATAKGGVRGQWGDECDAKTCAAMESEYHATGGLKAKFRKLWMEVELECAFGLEGCTEANGCGGCDHCAACSQDEFRSTCQVHAGVKG